MSPSSPPVDHPIRVTVTRPTVNYGNIPGEDSPLSQAGFGVESHVDSLTYRELQERRQLIQKRMHAHHRRR